MAPIPSDKSDSASESTIDLAAGYLGVIILAMCALLLLMLTSYIEYNRLLDQELLHPSKNSSRHNKVESKIFTQHNHAEEN
ncbi:hypothetical protein CBS147332_280 [Penicillium roqueforti]|nr:hypothetical protein CBS147332_280 [Penicillium roqueforti]